MTTSEPFVVMGRDELRWWVRTKLIGFCGGLQSPFEPEMIFREVAWQIAGWKQSPEYGTDWSPFLDQLTIGDIENVFAFADQQLRERAKNRFDWSK